MKCIRITLLLINTLTFFTLCKGSLLSGSRLTCKSKNIPVSLSPFNIEDILSFLNSQRGELEELMNVISTTEKTIEDSFLKASENDEDQHLNITELIEKYGFIAEEHDVTTDDGYVLTMQRIPGNGPLVLLMHGIVSSADDFVTCGPDNLPFLLASEGYDVWLGNGRGNKHSRKHVSLSPECEEFWQFSFDEMGRHDLPAMIDYALDASAQTNLTYVGFSQGTTNLLVLCSELPEYNKKISLAALLAPIGFMSHLKSPLLRIFALNTNYLIRIGTLLGLNEFAPNNLLTESLMSLFCGNNPLGKLICGSLLPLLSGFDSGLTNVQRLPAILSHLPAGGSLKQLAHYGQEILSGKLRRFDFTRSKNEEVYDSEQPPEYPLHEITSPIALFYGGNDWLANVIDVHQLRDSLPNVVHTKLIKKYSHVDLIWAKNSNKEIFRPLLKLIQKYQC